MKCLVDSKGRICEVRPAEQVFPVHPSLSWIDCPADVMPGDRFDGVAFHPRQAADPLPEPSPEAVTLRALTKKIGLELTPADLADALADLKRAP